MSKISGSQPGATVKRRQFLAASAAIPASLLLKQRTARMQPAAPGGFDPWIEVRPDHLRWNVEQVSRRVEGRPILAVIKNNGYGLGLATVGRIFAAIPAVSGLAVVKLDEAITLRETGIRKPVLLMGPVAASEWEEVVERNITPMIYTSVAAAELRSLAERRGKKIPVQICVDTGIGRVGAPHHTALSFIRQVAAWKTLPIAGIMMTFTEDPEFDREQLQRFEAFCAEAVRMGISLGTRHAASSFALFQNPASFLDQVRPGMALFGVYSEQEFRGMGVLDLKPAVALKTRVAYVKQLRAGDSAGYNRAFKTERPVWVATLPVGHTDGWPRVAAKGAKVRINGLLYPVVATVSASHTIVLLGAETGVRVGDPAVLFDWNEGSRPEDVAAACGASVYDLTMHLNPLLRRFEIAPNA